eukprot:g3930.t1
MTSVEEIAYANIEATLRRRCERIAADARAGTHGLNAAERKLLPKKVLDFCDAVLTALRERYSECGANFRESAGWSSRILYATNVTEGNSNDELDEKLAKHVENLDRQLDEVTERVMRHREETPRVIMQFVKQQIDAQRKADKAATDKVTMKQKGVDESNFSKKSKCEQNTIDALTKSIRHVASQAVKVTKSLTDALADSEETVSAVERGLGLSQSFSDSNEPDNFGEIQTMEKVSVETDTLEPTKENEESMEKKDSNLKSRKSGKKKSKAQGNIGKATKERKIVRSEPYERKSSSKKTSYEVGKSQTTKATPVLKPLIPKITRRVSNSNSIQKQNARKSAQKSNRKKKNGKKSIQKIGRNQAKKKIVSSKKKETVKLTHAEVEERRRAEEEIMAAFRSKDRLARTPPGGKKI